MNTMKFEELAKNDAFLAAVAACETNEEIQKAFAAEGVELTAEEVAEFVKTVADNTSDELDEGSLENVSGGHAGYAVAAGLAIVGAAVATRIAIDTIRFVARANAPKPAPHHPAPHRPAPHKPH